MKTITVLLAVTIAPFMRAADPAAGAGTNASTAPVTMTAQQDHTALKKLLNITALRPGRNGSNPQATNYANYDEAKANPFPKLPDPLLFKNGRKVTTAAQWWNQRRPEIVPRHVSTARVGARRDAIPWTMVVYV